MGLLTKSNPFFSAKLELFPNAKVVNGPSPPILLICKAFPSHVGKPFLPLGQIWDRNQFFLCDIQANPSSQKEASQFESRFPVRSDRIAIRESPAGKVGATPTHSRADHIEIPTHQDASRSPPDHHRVSNLPWILRTCCG
jgi:hypothetical protein